MLRDSSEQHLILRVVIRNSKLCLLERFNHAKPIQVIVRGPPRPHSTSSPYPSTCFKRAIYTMKRTRDGYPIILMHQGNRAPSSCQACREKKRRCDRTQPCSNCMQRNMSCEYPGRNPESSERDASKALGMASSSQTTIAQSQAPATVATSQ
jgi:hypothetical protein